MFDQIQLTHHIQRHIIKVLVHAEYARFRDMRPPRVETNLYSYHLKLLVKQGLVERTDQGYTLAARGMQYADRVNADKLKVRTQPKIVTMLLIQDGYGKVLLQRRNKQPYINTWSLPYGKLHIEDDSVTAAAAREADEKLGIAGAIPRHVGDCYIRVGQPDGPPATVLVHLCRFELDDYPETEDVRWFEPLDMRDLPLAPAIMDITTRAFFNDPFFFEEFSA